MNNNIISGVLDNFIKPYTITSKTFLWENLSNKDAEKLVDNYFNLLKLVDKNEYITCCYYPLDHLIVAESIDIIYSILINKDWYLEVEDKPYKKINKEDFNILAEKYLKKVNDNLYLFLDIQKLEIIKELI